MLGLWTRCRNNRPNYGDGLSASGSRMPKFWPCSRPRTWTSSTGTAYAFCTVCLRPAGSLSTPKGRMAAHTRHRRYSESTLRLAGIRMLGPAAAFAYLTTGSTHDDRHGVWITDKAPRGLGVLLERLRSVSEAEVNNVHP